MSIKLGTIEVNKTYSGGTQINKMYLGDTVVFGGGGGGDPYGPELFDINALIGLASGVTIVGDTIELLNAPLSTNCFTQSNFLTIGLTYKVTWTQTDWVTGKPYPLRPFSDQAGAIASNGVYLGEFVATQDDFIVRAAGTTTVTMSNISVKQLL